MDEEYELLTEKEKIWAEMYIQILEQNQIRYMVIPVNGIGLSMKTGSQDFLRIYYIKMTKSKTKRQKGKNNGKKNIQDQKERHAAVSAVSPGEGKLNSDHREIYERYEKISGICIRRRGDREGKTATV